MLKKNAVASYHSCDFDFNEHEAVAKRVSLPEIVPPSDNTLIEVPNIQWDLFYQQHQSGNVYKPRRYIGPEFLPWLEMINEKSGVIVEVGCGHGCTVLPLFSAFEHITFYLTDYSVNALRLLLNNNVLLQSKLPKYVCYDTLKDTARTDNITMIPPVIIVDTSDTPCAASSVTQPSESIDTHEKCPDKLRKGGKKKSRKTQDTKPGSCVISDEYIARIECCGVWDITTPFISPHPKFSDPCSVFHGLLCVFVLSAVLPEYHITALTNMRTCLKPGGSILFRDYAVYDMTMFRHPIRLSERLFQRHHIHDGDNVTRDTGTDGHEEGTLVYYFDIDYMRSIVEASGLHVSELEYATVINRNRRACGNNTNNTASTCTSENAIKSSSSSSSATPVAAAEMRRVFIHGVFTRPEA